MGSQKRKSSRNAAAVPNKGNKERSGTHGPGRKAEAGTLQFLIAVGGIYGSFNRSSLTPFSTSLTWALLQERLTTTPYGPLTAPEFFKFPVVLNTFQSLCAALIGCVYLRLTTSGGPKAPIFPNFGIFLPLLIVAITSSLASPFGYASLAHIDYITFTLAKSCKLLPVMFLNISLFQKRYPTYKYLVVLTVTLGVAVFTLNTGSGKKKTSQAALNPDRNRAWGLLLLGINLLFDGLTNTTQDYIFQSFQPYKGPQMMCANNIISSALTLIYLIFSPYLMQTWFGAYLGANVSLSMGDGGGELASALAFMARHPRVWLDVIGFALCGAVGQVFIFYTLSTFSSLLLVTITVTRKMLTMILSVVWFGHTLAPTQWLGVSLVFGGIGAEGIMARRGKSIGSTKTLAATKKEL
ncbi:UDP-Glc/Gal endoplasmic reticulum nucleotide sugar transporter [Blumeria hordei DH14]|uniref:UDP-galactose transporter homolog 1 n=1 Tax=Blumeria graminis f. sp. hordei (strain DH14) TaxID=546991 RepID=N1J850_BLUG1|nr:UDP-Glc/Gal endoplasmic reticulum nucleotide sugar transporter [Blumeria hordei DH14]